MVDSWNYVASHAKNLLPSKKGTPTNAPQGTPNKQKPNEAAAPSSVEAKKEDSSTPTPTEQNPTPENTGSPEEQQEKPEETSQAPQGVTPETLVTASKKSAVNFESLKNSIVLAFLWSKSKAVDSGNWAKQQASDFVAFLKATKEAIQKQREGTQLRKADDAKKPNTNRTKKISKDAYGLFGYEGFNEYKGTKKDPLSLDPESIDPELFFSTRTDIQTEPPVVEEEKKEQITTMAMLGGVPSTLTSRAAIHFTGLAEHDNTMKNTILNGGITLLTHTIPSLYEVNPALTLYSKHIPLLRRADKLNIHGKRLLFLINAGIFQYLFSHCIAYKSIPLGLKKALWDDINARKFALGFAAMHLFNGFDTKLDKDESKIRFLRKIVGFDKWYLPVRAAAILAMAGAFMKVMAVDQILETRGLILDIKKELAGQPYALGIKEPDQTSNFSLPVEMRGNRYLIFSSIPSKIASLLLFIANTITHVDVNDIPPLVKPAVTLLGWNIKALINKPVYLLESDLQYLRPETRERVVQHATSHRILSTMVYASCLASLNQTIVRAPKLYQAFMAEKPVRFKIATLRKLHEALPAHIRAKITLNEKELENDSYGSDYEKTRKTLVDLLLWNLSTDPSCPAELKQSIDNILSGKKDNTYRRLQRYSMHDQNNNNESSPLFKETFDLEDADLVDRLKDIFRADLEALLNQ